MSKLKEIDGRYYQECEVVMLAIDKRSCLFINKRSNQLQYYFKGNAPNNAKHQHLYFISNEKIKEGDYYYNDLFNMADQLIKGGLVTDDLIQTLNNNKHNRKIIATTDISLGLLQPSKSFIQAYIKSYNEGKPITKVLVEMEGIGRMKSGGEFTPITYKLKINSNNEITIKKIKDSYTREEIEKLFNKWRKDFPLHRGI